MGRCGNMGSAHDHPKQKMPCHITITNTTTLTAALPGVLIALVLIAGFDFSQYLRLFTVRCMMPAFLTAPLMNWLGYYNLSGLRVCWSFPVFAIAIPVLSQMYGWMKVSIISTTSV
jgi:hypothetical protein